VSGLRRTTPPAVIGCAPTAVTFARGAGRFAALVVALRDVVALLVVVFFAAFFDADFFNAPDALDLPTFAAPPARLPPRGAGLLAFAEPRPLFALALRPDFVVLDFEAMAIDSWWMLS
jgi:hypothetical protein